MKSIIINNTRIYIYTPEVCDTPIPTVYVNIFEGDGSDIRQCCIDLCCPEFTMAAISVPDWENDMSPWPGAAVFPNGAGYSGNAGSYLHFLTSEIVPHVGNITGHAQAYSAIAGYSLGGLFAVYSAYNTTAFTRFASVSGSLWYPGFVEYVSSHTMAVHPDYFYLSLGDKEEKTHNKIISAVGRNTSVFSELLYKEHINTVYEINTGGHYNEPAMRTAKGICHILSCR